ncbi:lysophospholipase L1-like esterase [Bacilli bacterium PM5-3]|nr:lysophospholipase L1-like esterase [Bacilli bacterium PM5-3]MDH6604308.1 lysophospholipase L1-like esterase [Bacilli bacterium PM5-9]
MKNILIFGDSNTYGLKADGSGRFTYDIRYPGRLQKLLGNEYFIVEEGCPGRTTIFEDPTRYHLKATDYLFPCLYSHLPLDLIVIMLGTNDCKTVFDNSSDDIKEGLRKVVTLTKEYTENKVPILIMVPPTLGDDIYLDTFDEDFADKSLVVAKELAQKYKDLANEEKTYYFDASKYVKVSPIDQEHMDEKNHEILADKLVSVIKDILK